MHNSIGDTLEELQILSGFSQTKEIYIEMSIIHRIPSKLKEGPLSFLWTEVSFERPSRICSQSHAALMSMIGNSSVSVPHLFREATTLRKQGKIYSSLYFLTPIFSLTMLYTSGMRSQVILNLTFAFQKLFVLHTTELGNHPIRQIIFRNQVELLGQFL